MELRAGDLRAVLTYTENSLRVGDYAQVRSSLLVGLTSLVGGDRVALTHLDLRTQHEVAVFWPPSCPVDSATLAAYAELGRTHPLRRPLREPSARLRPLRISDVVGQRAWRATALYREVLRGTADQLCLPLSVHGPSVRAITLSRATGTFTARQRDLLAACAAHLRSALGRARHAGHSGHQLAPAPGVVPLSVAPGLAPGGPAPAALSARERQVLGLVAQGLTDAQAARRLGLRPATVSKHLHRVYARHGLHNRAEATRLWIESTAVPGGRSNCSANRVN